MLRVFNLDVYDLLDQGTILSFLTPYIAIKFNVTLETLSNPFLVSTAASDPVIATWVYINCLIIVSQESY